MICILCGLEGFVVTPWGPVPLESGFSSFVCRDDYPLYGENGQHVVQ